jgi:biopolymer transport protein ExbB
MKKTEFEMFWRVVVICLCLGSGRVLAQETDADVLPSVNGAVEAGMEGGGTVDTTRALFEKLRGSGKTGLALLGFSLVGFSVAFERMFNLRRVKVVPEGMADRADRLWQAGDVEGVKRLAGDHPSSLGRVLVAIADHRQAGHNDVSMLAGDVASREMRYHLQRAYPLAVVATISPLLGLFGTVYGMIGAFESVALAGEMGDPSIMAGDISYALMTTALGLVIAVPTLTLYHFFRIRTNLLALGLEEQCSHLISRWFGPATGSNAVNPQEV